MIVHRESIGFRSYISYIYIYTFDIQGDKLMTLSSVSPCIQTEFDKKDLKSKSIDIIAACNRLYFTNINIDSL